MIYRDADISLVIVPTHPRQHLPHRALPQLYGAAFIGAIVMVLADWLGRVAMFPFILPAGLLATLIGGPTFFYLMLKNPARVAN